MSRILPSTIKSLNAKIEPKTGQFIANSAYTIELWTGEIVVVSKEEFEYFHWLLLAESV